MNRIAALGEFAGQRTEMSKVVRSNGLRFATPFTYRNSERRGSPEVGRECEVWRCAAVYIATMHSLKFKKFYTWVVSWSVSMVELDASEAAISIGVLDWTSTSRASFTYTYRVYLLPSSSWVDVSSIDSSIV